MKPTPDQLLDSDVPDLSGPAPRQDRYRLPKWMTDRKAQVDAEQARQQKAASGTGGGKGGGGGSGS